MSDSAPTHPPESQRAEPLAVAGRRAIDWFELSPDLCAVLAPAGWQGVLPYGCLSGHPKPRPDGQLGYFSKRFEVYDREGEPCRRGDGGTVRRLVQGGRSTWYCPRCQY